MSAVLRPRCLPRRDTMTLLEELARAAPDGEDVGPSGVVGALQTAMERAGLHPALVHAFRVTGMMVSEENQDLWTRAELDLWTRAVDRYQPGLPVVESAPPSGRIAALLANSRSS